MAMGGRIGGLAPSQQPRPTSCIAKHVPLEPTADKAHIHVIKGIPVASAGNPKQYDCPDTSATEGVEGPFASGRNSDFSAKLMRATAVGHRHAPRRTHTSC